MEKAQSVHIGRSGQCTYVHLSYLLIHSFVVIGFMTSRYNETNSSSTIPNSVVPGPRLRFYEDSLGK